MSAFAAGSSSLPGFSSSFSSAQPVHSGYELRKWLDERIETEALDQAQAGYRARIEVGKVDNEHKDF